MRTQPASKSSTLGCAARRARCPAANAAGLPELKPDTNFWDVFELKHGNDGVRAPHPPARPHPLAAERSHGQGPEQDAEAGLRQPRRSYSVPLLF